MQSTLAKQIRKDWGDKPCEHPEFDKEYYLGAQTGDYVCVQCGRCFPEQQMKSILEEKTGPDRIVHW